MSTRKTTAERIEAAKQEKAQMEAEIKRLLNLQKAEERKARNHRISKRGAHIESLLPDTIMLSDARFYTFLEKTIANDFGRRALAALKTEQEKEDAANSTADTADGGDAPVEPATVAAAQGGNTPTAKSDITEQNIVKSGAAKPAQTAVSPGVADGSGTGDGARQGA